VEVHAVDIDVAPPVHDDLVGALIGRVDDPAGAHRPGVAVWVAMESGSLVAVDRTAAAEPD
jgi:hypothetical protein